jgi:hypothetical protein
MTKYIINLIKKAKKNMIKICSKCGEEKEIKKYCVCDECKKEQAKNFRAKYKLNEPKEKKV